MIGRRRSRIPVPPPEHANRARINDKIRALSVRLIDQDGAQVGVVTIQDALRRAQEAGFDLVEVAADAKPPVCKIQDYSKFLFELQKKERSAKANAHKVDTKEVRLRPGTGDGDLEIKAKHAREFILEGHKVSLQLRFRGREMAHQDIGIKVLERIRTELEVLTKVEQMPKMENRQMVMVLSPR